MKSIIQELKASKLRDVVVIGDLMLDEYIIGSVERVSPEAPVPILKKKGCELSFGGAANVAINCKQAGCNVHLNGFVGKDKEGEKLVSMLVEQGIGVDGVIDSNSRVTTSKKRIVSQQQQLLRIDSEDTHVLTKYERDKFINKIYEFIKSGCIVIISDYAKGIVDYKVIEEVIIRAKKYNVIVVVDPKGPDFDKYRGVSYIKPNLKEFHQMVHYFGLSREASIVENGKHICKLLSLKGLIVTMGEQGLQFVSQEKQLFCPACRREVYDITGAGDTVLAFLAIGLVNGISLEQSLELANQAAAVAVSHHKTYTVGLDELLNNGIQSSEKIFYDWKKLKSELDCQRKENGKRIVFTNGCFDLLHSGHIFVLQEAKKRGDVLVVAVNTDDSVRRFKGQFRPIKSLSERLAVISAVGVVDFVVAFDQDTPRELINFIKPDILIKGGDYKLEKIAGYDEVISSGGKVEIIEYKDGLSTSNLINRIKENSLFKQ